jgi:uroporphyrinogen-III synthase
VSTAPSLAGKRILITRAAHQASRLAEALLAKGAQTLLLPTIAIEPPESYAPLDAALAAIESASWLILTSANGARVLGERMRALALPLHRLAHLRVACIGPATAREAAELGLKIAVVPQEHVAEGLVEALRGKVLPGDRVLLVRAAAARDVVPEELGRLGIHVSVVDAYRTVIPPGSVDQVRGLLALGKTLPDAVTFTSSSSVTNFLALLQAAGLARPASLSAVSIGPVTSRTLREHGWEPAVEAARSDIEGLVEACEKLFVS